MSDKKFKWGVIQPLTGGMYIGARNAIGYDAEWCLSFPGLRDVKYNKEGVLTLAGNEYNLYNWFAKHNINLPYYTFNRGMFDQVGSLEDVILSDGEKDVQLDYSDIDLVVAVPVCSGLSRVTTSSKEAKDEHNRNMLFIASYALGVIKPKIYIFENAPELYSNRGEEVRSELETIAKKYGYSVLYYKTDTQYHANCQKRPRTFVIFQKWNNGVECKPQAYGYEHIEYKLAEYLSKIPAEATQQEPLPMTHFNRCLIDYAKKIYGDDWRIKSYRDTMANFVKTGAWNDFSEFMHSKDYITEQEMEKYDKFLDHAHYKVSIGKNYYSMSAYIGDPDKIGSVQFKSMSSYLHPTEERHYTVREALHLMGMPHDFELLGAVEANFPKIGQNVPVRTAQFIVAEAVKILDNWDEKRESGSNVLFQDNTK